MQTRGEDTIGRLHLFPPQLLSIFGISQVFSNFSFPPNLSALQNFVSHLYQKKRFISLELNKDPNLTYWDEDEDAKVTLMLKDRPRVQQIFYNGGFFRPCHTDVRIESLIFFVQWLYRNKIKYKFTNINDLTVMTLNDKHRIRLCYKYILSLSDVQNMTLLNGDIVINLHNWNNAPISQDAKAYASKINVRLFSQNNFLTFAHKYIK